MALTHLLDTSVVSRLSAPTVRSVIEPLVQEGRIGRAGITDLEVGFGS
jgi:predicted nucleic acid-binding protein